MTRSLPLLALAALLAGLSACTGTDTADRAPLGTVVFTSPQPSPPPPPVDLTIDQTRVQAARPARFLGSGANTTASEAALVAAAELLALITEVATHPDGDLVLPGEADLTVPAAEALRSVGRSGAVHIEPRLDDGPGGAIASFTARGAGGRVIELVFAYVSDAWRLLLVSEVAP